MQFGASLSRLISSVFLWWLNVNKDKTHELILENASTNCMAACVNSPLDLWFSGWLTLQVSFDLRVAFLMLATLYRFQAAFSAFLRATAFCENVAQKLMERPFGRNWGQTLSTSKAEAVDADRIVICEEKTKLKKLWHFISVGIWDLKYQIDD